MKVDGRSMRTIWLADDGWAVEIIDQTLLPHQFVTTRLETLDAAAHAIRSMQVRGAPLIGAAATVEDYIRFGLAQEQAVHGCERKQYDCPSSSGTPCGIGRSSTCNSNDITRRRSSAGARSDT